MKYFLRALLTPSCWLQNFTYSEAWDRKLKELMETHRFIYISPYTAQIGNYQVWVSNHPYASFTTYPNSVRPKRATIFKAWEKYQADMLEQ